MTPAGQPVLTRAEVREIDRWAIEDLGIPGIVLMENAGRNAAAVIRSMLAEKGASQSPCGAGCQPVESRGAAMPFKGRVAVVCGRGNNGGDGFVIARHLANAGCAVEAFLTCPPDKLTGDAATNHAVARNMSLPITVVDTAERARTVLAPALRRADLVVDAVLGTGFSGEVRSPLAEAIDAVNAARPALIVAIDVPSGLDCDTGEPSNATVRADATVTFVAMKVGFTKPGASAYTGRVHVADIGAPVAQ